MNSHRVSCIGSVIFGLTVLLHVGCTRVGPQYVPPAPPEVAAPVDWSAELGGGLTTGAIDTQALAAWWTTLNDPTLSRLSDRAVAGNLDLRQARARIREARALWMVEKSGRLPTVAASASASVSRTGDTIGRSVVQDLYSAGFDASWEADVFGGISRSIEAAEVEFQASQEDLRDVLVSLLAEVALNYVDVRTFQTRLAIAEANMGAQEETYNITRWRFKAGLTTQLDVEQAKSNLEQTRSQIPTLQTGLEQTKNRLAVLLGENPGSLHAELAQRQPIPLAPPDVAVGVPADLLRRRPDIRRAERNLAAQTARVGVATAELYPRFNLIGSIGLETLSLGNLFSVARMVTGVAGSLQHTIFDRRRIRQNIEVQTALQEQALIGYEAAVLTALEDVENALVAYADEQARRQALLQSSQAAQRAVDLALQQYSSGLVDFQVVLDAQRSLLSLQDQLATSEGNVTANLISLYKALGGGWTSLAPAVAEPDAKE